MSTLPIVVIVVFALISLAFLVMGVRALRRRRLFKSAVSVTFSFLLLSVSAVFLLLTIAAQGYRGLTHEQIVAVVETTPGGPGRFTARFTFPDGRRAEFELAGDQIYVDAHILKWKPIANVFGLHTAYELDRVAGRYAALEDEQHGARTVYSLAADRAVDIFELRQRYRFLSPLLDAEYGSATFAAATGSARYEVRLSTTGLLIRPLPSNPEVPI